MTRFREVRTAHGTGSRLTARIRELGSNRAERAAERAADRRNLTG